MKANSYINWLRLTCGPQLLRQHDERFARVLREGALLVEGRLENSPEERCGNDVGLYRSILLERIWSLEAILQGPGRAQNTVQLVEQVVHGAAGHPGQSPRLSASK